MRGIPCRLNANPPKNPPHPNINPYAERTYEKTRKKPRVASVSENQQDVVDGNALDVSFFHHSFEIAFHLAKFQRLLGLKLASFIAPGLRTQGEFEVYLSTPGCRLVRRILVLRDGGGRIVGHGQRSLSLVRASDPLFSPPHGACRAELSWELEQASLGIVYKTIPAAIPDFGNDALSAQLCLLFLCIRPLDMDGEHDPYRKLAKLAHPVVEHLVKKLGPRDYGFHHPRVQCRCRGVV